MSVLALEGITHSFGEKLAVDALDLAIDESELVCLLGPSGCGKTTALRIAAGLQTLQEGRVVVDGRTMAEPGREVPPEDRGIGLVFQDYALFPHLTVLENVAFGLRHLPTERRRDRAAEALEQVEMGGSVAAYPHTLSGGQQQRVALARALAPNPRVMLLDEPFSGLDASLRNQVRDQTLHVLKESGAATLMVTHDPEEAMFMADRVALMREGAIVQLGCPTDLYFTPRDAFVARFFGEVNYLPGQASQGRVATPLGEVAAEGLPDGTAVDVLIRPEAIHLAPVPADAQTPAATARVLASRLLGRTSLVHLAMGGTGREELHLHARVPGRFLPKEDERLSVRLDHAQAFVFPNEALHFESQGR